MQTVSAAFTAEEKDTVRRIVHNLQVSWKKQTTIGNRTFTIGVSIIGGNDVIGINPGAIGSPSNYKYFDESAYVLSMAWERGLNMPLGGLSMAYGEAILDNTSGRFTPRFMGGRSELFTAIEPRRPTIIGAGFVVDGINQTIPQFTGTISDQPNVDKISGQMAIKMSDYVDFFQNRQMDRAAIFTSQRTDVVIERLLVQAGMSTSQYDLDPGINIINFGMFDVGTKFAPAINQLVEAENGHFYQDEMGIFRFENRQHWDSAQAIQRVITTSQVLNMASPDVSHLINVVEVNGKEWTKQPRQIIFSLSNDNPLYLAPSSKTDLYVNFTDPLLQLETPTGWVVNTISDGSGTDISSSVTLANVDTFAQATRITFSNNSSSPAYMVGLTLYGRQMRATNDIYYRAQIGSSITAYEEQVQTIDNPFIQDESWAASYSNMILGDYSSIENVQKLTIRAQPDLQLGAYISWQGRYWRVFDIKSTLSPDAGFIQELLLVQKNMVSYFRIGISTIGGIDKIAP